ncbi:MAG: hypothetical protein KKD92_03125 [Proteobacteria bacterium]|nr:hypothetical protein [Pseudomonadota bacterium]
MDRMLPDGKGTVVGSRKSEISCPASWVRSRKSEIRHGGPSANTNRQLTTAVLPSVNDLRGIIITAS